MEDGDARAGRAWAQTMISALRHRKIRGMNLPLNALRAFEASARHLSFTLAAEELHVTQSAISAQVKNLEQRLGRPLFRRLPRGLALTDEGQALLPTLKDTFARLAALIEPFERGRPREPLTVAAVGTYAVGWLMPRLAGFAQAHPFVDLRLQTHNNLVNLASEGLDCAIRFGDGAWHGTEAEPLQAAPLSPVCAPALAARLRSPADLAGQTLLRSYRSEEWPSWFRAAGLAPPLLRGPVFDTSLAMASAAAQGFGVALLPPSMFEAELRQGRLLRPFTQQISEGRYWLTRLKSRPASTALQAFSAWLRQEVAAGGDAPA